jgi:hypothetical protein
LKEWNPSVDSHGSVFKMLFIAPRACFSVITLTPALKIVQNRVKIIHNRGFPKTSVSGKATLKFAVLQGCYKIKSLKNCKSLA